MTVSFAFLRTTGINSFVAVGSIVAVVSGICVVCCEQLNNKRVSETRIAISFERRENVFSIDRIVKRNRFRTSPKGKVALHQIEMFAAQLPVHQDKKVLLPMCMDCSARRGYAW